MSDDYDPRALLGESKLGVLATLKADGTPQLSPVTFHYDRVRDAIYFATLAGYVKAKNLARNPLAVLQVISSDNWSWATAEGSTTLIGPGAEVTSPEVEALVDYYRAAAGEHANWDEYRAVMVAERRILVTIDVTSVYGERLMPDGD